MTRAGAVAAIGCRPVSVLDGSCHSVHTLPRLLKWGLGGATSAR